MSKRPEFLAACMAGAAIVARVDGWVSAVEMDLIRRLNVGTGPLAGFDTHMALAQFDHFVRLVESPKGLEVAWEAIDRVASDPIEAKTVLSFCNAIAMADRVLEGEEALLLRMIASHLGLSPEPAKS